MHPLVIDWDRFPSTIVANNFEWTPALVVFGIFALLVYKVSARVSPATNE